MIKNKNFYILIFLIIYFIIIQVFLCLDIVLIILNGMEKQMLVIFNQCKTLNYQYLCNYNKYKKKTYKKIIFNI
jgi:hypothetical protein